MHYFILILCLLVFSLSNVYSQMPSQKRFKDEAEASAFVSELATVFSERQKYCEDMDERWQEFVGKWELRYGEYFARIAEEKFGKGIGQNLIRLQKSQSKRRPRSSVLDKFQAVHAEVEAQLTDSFVVDCEKWRKEEERLLQEFVTAMCKKHPTVADFITVLTHEEFMLVVKVGNQVKRERQEKKRDAQLSNDLYELMANDRVGIAMLNAKARLPKIFESYDSYFSRMDAEYLSHFTLIPNPNPEDIQNYWQSVVADSPERFRLGIQAELENFRQYQEGVRSYWEALAQYPYLYGLAQRQLIAYRRAAIANRLAWVRYCIRMERQRFLEWQRQVIAGL